MPRLFFALQPAPLQQAVISAAVMPMVQALGARPTLQADLHLTLAFLGEVQADAVPDLLRAARDLPTGLSALQLSQVDCWAESGVLRLLPEENAITHALRPLVRKLEGAAQDVSIRIDDRPFRPHVTVARKVPRAASMQQAWPQPLASPLPFTANGFVLMESIPGSAGPRYRVIHSWLPWPGDM